MSNVRKAERGEGKIGCIITLIVLLLAIALVIKIVPVYYANNGLVNAAEELGSRAGLLTKASIEVQLRAKAQELEIPEALAPGAMAVNVIGVSGTGTCVIKLKFTRKVDLYGAYDFPVEMNQTISRPFMDAR